MTAPRRSRPLAEVVAEGHPGAGDPVGLIASGRVRVDGIPVTNPRSGVRPGASVTVRRPAPLRGEAKLRAALAAFAVSAAGRVAVDVGAAAGGFTRVLLEAGAARVYAVDAGHGQLLGSLRQDPRVVNLEATNVARLDRELVPEPVELVTVDVSYLSLSAAAAQLGGLELAATADLIGLIKPMFELRLAAPPSAPGLLAAATTAAVEGLERARWRVAGVVPSPVAGARGALELLVHARRGR